MLSTTKTGANTAFSGYKILDGGKNEEQKPIVKLKGVTATERRYDEAIAQDTLKSEEGKASLLGASLTAERNTRTQTKGHRTVHHEREVKIDEISFGNGKKGQKKSDGKPALTGKTYSETFTGTQSTSQTTKVGGVTVGARKEWSSGTQYKVGGSVDCKKCCTIC